MRRADGLHARIACVFLFAIAAAAPAWAGHAKIDLVELTNGNQITCEIVKFDRGKITAKTDALGTLSIEWDSVRRVVSPFQYDVELGSGRQLLGSLAMAGPQRILIRTDTGDEDVSTLDVVRMVPIERGFWERLDGSVDLGFSFTQAEALTQISLNARSSRRTPTTAGQASLSSLVTVDDEANRQRRNTLTVGFNRFLRDRWFAGPLGQFSSNEELGLDFRSVAGGGIGRYLIQSNRTVLALVGSVVFTHEQFEHESGDNRAEAQTLVQWDYFTFGNNETDLSNTFQVYYNLGSEWRTRMELATNFRRKFFKDFYWSVNLLESFDSAPPASQKKNDVSINLALGWSF